MKENNGMKTKIVNIKEYSSNEVGFLVQVVLIELLIIFAIINTLTDVFVPAFYAILAMLMFTMAYNNKKIFKRKCMTFFYLLTGLFATITAVMEYIF